MIAFKKYKKVARTVARLLTAQDYEARQGLIYAPEGILRFTPGDYLAKDAKGEWPIRQRTMRERYVKVASEDEEGLAHYLRTDVSFAAPMPEPFTIDEMRGKAGDYLVVNEGAGWPVDRELFEQTYQLVEAEQLHCHPENEKVLLSFAAVLCRRFSRLVASLVREEERKYADPDRHRWHDCHTQSAVLSADL